MKKVGWKSVIFVAIVVLYPVLIELYRVMPVMDIPPYVKSSNFFFLLFKALGFLLVTLALNLSFNKLTSPVFRYGSWVLITSGIFQVYMALPFSKDIGLGLTVAIALLTAPALIILMRIIANRASSSLLEKEMLHSYTLEYNMDELKRTIQKIRLDDTSRIMLAQASIVHAINMIRSIDDLDGQSELIEQNIAQTIKSTLNIEKRTTIN